MFNLHLQRIRIAESKSPMNEIKKKKKILTKENVLLVQIKHFVLSTVISHAIESNLPLPIQYIYQM